MLKELDYPFDAEYILKKSKSLRRQLLSDGNLKIHKKIAVLGGSTTHDIIRILELFLLNQGIEPEFYESEYGRYWEDAVFGSEKLDEFQPDVIYIHTSNRNIKVWPALGDSDEVVADKLDTQYTHFEKMWEVAADKWNCPIIQNNFELPFYRTLGNQDGVNVCGKTSFINRLNNKFSEYARNNDNFYINDIHYQSAAYGLDAWSAPLYWHMYKYSLCLSAIPWLTHNIANIIKSIYGKNKKSLVLDLDNTLWGGVVGEDGPENLELGPETSMGQVYMEVQSYIKELKTLGVMLNVDSKNNEENALAGLLHPDGILKPEDFLVIKANWEPKSKNIMEIAAQLNILPDSLVFVDDNPAEREIVRAQASGVSVPEIGVPEDYIRNLDHGGYFEVTNISNDDLKRNDMYKADRKRQEQQSAFTDYRDYLLSLNMKAEIAPFSFRYMSRIAQLTNKSNQFNLTTKRFTQGEIEKISADEGYITLYGRLEDRFGDNGVVSVVIGRIEDKRLHIELWLMSCRVLKRDMEYAMMDALVKESLRYGINTVYGYYYPTAKNKMVQDFYLLQGFEKVEENESGTIWRLELSEQYENKNRVIELMNTEEEL